MKKVRYGDKLFLNRNHSVVLGRKGLSCKRSEKKGMTKERILLEKVGVRLDS